MRTGSRDMENMLAGGIAALLIVYLLVTLIRPEWF
jgi:K+-transporting ATPase KdpF subunit